CAATSRSNLNRKLRSLVGITAAQLLIDARMQRAAQLLGRKDGERPTVAETAYRCGYSDPRYFSRCFKQKYGVTPSEFEG
ncbi:MAG: helix-turn-helix transcriptional regulator, partial [Prevotella sp.]|nr:helix-turn-helix transcriptional regulator [Prevotella sp.]